MSKNPAKHKIAMDSLNGDEHDVVELLSSLSLVRSISYNKHSRQLTIDSASPSDDNKETRYIVSMDYATENPGKVLNAVYGISEDEDEDG
jgi:hypothetical protein